MYKKWIWIDNAIAYGSEFEVQMTGCAAGIAGVSHITQYIALVDDVARPKTAESIQVGIVEQAKRRSHDKDHIAAQFILADESDNSVRGARYRSAAPRENIDALMTPVIGPGRTETVIELTRFYACHRNRQCIRPCKTSKMKQR
jgi:hypothetical protein